MTVKPAIKDSKKLFIFLIVLGLAMIAAGLIISAITQDSELGARITGFGCGLGSGILAVGVVNLIRIRRKPDIKRQEEINEKDERHIKIRERSAMSAFYVTLLSIVLAVFVFVCLGEWVACYICVGVLFVHNFGYLFFLNHYAKKF